MNVLRLSDYQRMPWKNGGGVTLEIAVLPSASSAGDFDWRISMATVATDGPFSVFPGIDRILTVIDGDAIELALDGRPPVLLDQTSAPYAFAGDIPTAGRLRDGPIADLNVMVRRGLPHSVIRLQTADLPKAKATSKTLFVVALEATAFRCGQETITLGRHDTVDLSATALADIVVDTSGAALLIAIG